jgi:hypothetical protein
VVNVSERVEVPKKTIQTSQVQKRGRATTKKDDVMSKHLRKERKRPDKKVVNASQPMVERHLVDTKCPQSSTHARNINEAETSENPGSLVLENHEEPQGIEEISINYTNSGETYDRSTIIANTCFSTIIDENFLNNPEPKTMVECMKHSD